MEISFLRDLVIVILGILGIGATIISLVLLIVIYRKVIPILNSVRDTTSNLRDASSTFYKNVVEPIARLQGLIAGIRRTVEFISSITKKGEQKHEQ